MSCERFAEPIALLAGGDLPERQVPAVRAHLAACPACRHLLAELESTIRETETLGAEPVESRLLAEVRTGVLARLDRLPSPRPWRRLVGWRVAVAAATLVVVLLAISVARRPAPPVAGLPPSPATAPRLPHPTTSSPAVVAAATAAVPHHPPSRHATPTAATGRAAPGGEVVATLLLSNDPDVVIYWIPETTGGNA